MKYFLVSLVGCFFILKGYAEEEPPERSLFISTPDQIATLSSEPDYLIGGVISPLSGQPSMRQVDLIARGAENVVLSRIYIPPYMPTHFPQKKKEQSEWDKRYLYYHLRQNYKGWQYYPHIRLEAHPLLPKGMKVRFSDPNGMTLDFRWTASDFSLGGPPFAISNLVGDTPSGKYDPRNTRLYSIENGNKIVVHAPDGTIRYYANKGRVQDKFFLNILEKEVLPNGKVLRYRYNKFGEPECVESLDPQERYVYASIHISGSPWAEKCHFTASMGQTAAYTYQKKPIHWKVHAEIIGGGTHKEEHNFLCPPILTNVSSPFYRHESLGYCGRFLLESFSGTNHIFNCYHTGFGAANHYRVHHLHLPVGQNDAFTTVYELHYEPPVAGIREGVTKVKNSDGIWTIYKFSKNFLTDAIQYLDQNGVLKKEKVFVWDDKNWVRSIEMLGSQKDLLYKRSFEYDRFGNPILEVFTGDLTGEGNQDTFTTKRVFSDDGRNLLLREETEDGKITCFSYLPNTNLVTSKLTKDGDHIILREFSIYDDCNNLLQTISDDGTSEDKDNLSHVTQRTLKTYILRQSTPFFHMPEWIQETYLEDGAEKLLKKSHLIYDQHGNIAQEEVYDAQGKHAYTICKTYNERGDVLSKTNRLEQEAVYTYDARGRPETSLNFSHRLHTTFHHDTKGRLKEQTEKGDDGIVHTTSSEYDFYDRKIQKKDSFQNTTRYTYDPFVSEITKADFPPISSIDGQATPVSTLSSYDPFGRELTKTDGNGNTTTYHYNAYGSHTEIIHPHGGKETFRYAKNGQLSSYTDLDGTAIYYKRDVLGRVLSKTYISSDGKTLAEEIFTYNGFNLLTKTDKEGNLKQYSYDGAGRKIREDFCDQITDFNYDALGWLSTVCKHNGDNTLLIHYKRDPEGQILEECKTDASGHILYKISYSYDNDGNRETIIRYINEKKAIDTFTYDSFCRLIQHQDAEEFITRTTYNEHFANPLGQKVLQKKTVDPRQITTLETQDALNRTAKIEMLNSQGAHISCHDLIHDSQGNLLYRRDYVYENDRFRSTQTVKYVYTPDHQIESITRAFGTKDARTTFYSYLPSGKVATKTLPDDVTLTYSYHPLGFMSRIDSSDGKIHHAFEYDRLGYLRSALDENHNIAIQREVDPFGNVTCEIFPFNIEVKKDYDDFNRSVSMQIASHGKIFYDYDPLFLRQVTRVSEQEENLYSHTYDEYDLNGNLTFEDMIGGLGRISHVTGARGQKASISSPYFVQNCQYDSVGNLVTSIVDKAEHRYSYDGISQLSSENSPEQSTAYSHDSLYNRVQTNGELHEVNDLNEIMSLDGMHGLYDLNGNQILRKVEAETARLTYDPLNRLTEAVSKNKKIKFTYDPLGRRLSKTVYTSASYGWKESDYEYYLYDDQNEMGAFTAAHELKNLRVLGLATHKDNPTTVGIEIEGQIFAPLLDVQGSVRRLVSLSTKSIINSYDFTAVGELVSEEIVYSLWSYLGYAEPFNPWRFAAKRFDPELGLIYFGKRYYDPRLGRWLTTDPAGFVDSFNLYQYVLNNPFRYYDPRGESLGGYLLGLGEIVLGGAIMAGGFALEVITVGGFTIGLGVTTNTGAALIGLGLATTAYHAQDISLPKSSHISSAEKRHTPDQEAISELVKEYGKKGVSDADADTLLDWAEEYDFPNRDDRGKPPHWKGGQNREHIHLGPKHIPITD